jgi:hypothetical protein
MRGEIFPTLIFLRLQVSHPVLDFVCGLRGWPTEYLFSAVPLMSPWFMLASVARHT